MSQTSYSQAMAVGRPGMLADNGPRDVVSKVNPVVAIKFGRAVCRGTDGDRDVKLPTTAAEAAASVGVALIDLSVENSASGDPQYPVGSAVAVLKRGRVWVQVTETVVAGNPVYVRYADGINDGNDDDKGGFSDTADGTAQVDTITPTAVNSTVYGVYVNERYFEYLSDGSATAAEIVAGLTALINGDTTCPVTASGSTTLILTANAAGTAFTTQVGPSLAVAHTTPNAKAAALLPGAKFVTGANEDGYAIVDLNLSN